VPGETLGTLPRVCVGVELGMGLGEGDGEAAGDGEGLGDGIGEADGEGLGDGVGDGEGEGDGNDVDAVANGTLNEATVATVAAPATPIVEADRPPVDAWPL
jgi:hypothetical protein